MNILSLFDGISCGQIALNEAGIKFDNYYASEIDKDCIKVTMKNYPDTIQLGDVQELNITNLPKIDLLFGGSPCQSFSNAGKGEGFDGKSKLFWEYVRILREVKPKYFLLENVKMKQEWRDIITEAMGVQPVEINSKRFVPQNRPRLYWTNIPIKDIEDVDCCLSDVLLPDGDERLEKFKLSDKAVDYMGRLRNDKPRWDYHTNPLNGNAACLTANMFKGVPYGVIKDKMRRLHPIECERLQGVPDNYTDNVSTTQRLKMIGNGWTVDVIRHIFEGLKPIKKKVNKKLNVLSLFDGMSCGQIALGRAGIEYENYYSAEIDKHAIKETMANYPNTIQVGDVTKITASDLPKIDLLIGGSPCFTAGNLVMTNDGYKPIEDIVVGDMVLTHKNRYKKVLRIGGEIKETIRVKSQGSSMIETTRNHPFYCFESNGENSDFCWKNIGDFSKKDKVVSINWGVNIDFENFSNIDLYILGRFLADGCCYKTKRKDRDNSYIYKFKISVGKHEIDDFKSKVDDRFTYIEEKTVYNAFIYKKEWVEIGEKFGHLAHNKFIPNFILDLPIDRLKIFINGYMDGDGHVRKQASKVNVYKRNTTVSEKLALTLSLAIQKCYNGVSINYTKRENTCVIEGRVVNQKGTYEVSYTENKTKFSKYKIINDYTIYNLTKSVSFVETGTNPVYNIEVEEDNSYVVNNLIVHNCQGFSFSGKQLNFEDPRSKLFFEFVRLLKECNPKYFLLENVVMKKEYEQVITDYLGVEPIQINSTLVAAQNRVRLYWTNIPNVQQPEDRNIRLIDILEDDVMIGDTIVRKENLNKGTILGRRLNNEGKRDDYNKSVPIVQCLEIRASNREKSNCITTVAKDNVLSTLPIGRHVDAFNKKLPFRYYTTTEYSRLQTVPDDYFKVSSDNQIRKMIGNGWTVDVIAHIFSNIE